jgi:hypothetical protein
LVGAFETVMSAKSVPATRLGPDEGVRKTSIAAEFAVKLPPPERRNVVTSRVAVNSAEEKSTVSGNEAAGTRNPGPISPRTMTWVVFPVRVRVLFSKMTGVKERKSGGRTNKLPVKLLISKAFTPGLGGGGIELSNEITPRFKSACINGGARRASKMADKEAICLMVCGYIRPLVSEDACLG